MEQFKKAIQIAKEFLVDIQSGLIDARVEAAIVNNQKNWYEISFSYRLDGKSDLAAPEISKQDTLSALALLSPYNRIYKTILIDADTWELKGFKEYKEA